MDTSNDAQPFDPFAIGNKTGDILYESPSHQRKTETGTRFTAGVRRKRVEMTLEEARKIPITREAIDALIVILEAGPQNPQAGPERQFFYRTAPKYGWR